MDIENLVNRVTNTQRLLEQGKKELFSGDALVELCTRLKQTCAYIVDINYDADKNPDGYYVHRFIKYMSVKNIVDKDIPIRKLEWTTNETWVCATISSEHGENVRVCFPAGEKQYADFINDHIYALKIKELNRIKTNEQYIKDKTGILQWIILFKSKYPDMMKDLVDSISVD